MLDFPDNPAEGDTHSEEGQIWTYLSGAWVMGGSKTTSQTIVEDDTGAGYQVIGDVLVQWGVEPGGVTTERTVTFPIGFASLPTVECTPNNLDTQVGRYASANAVTITGFTTRVRAFDGTHHPDPVGWVAYGEAPDNLKKPKTVVVGGAKQGGMEVVPLWVGDTQTDVTLSDSYLNYDLLMWETQENTGRCHFHQIDPARFAQMTGGSNNVWSVRAADANTTRSYEIYPQDETTIIMSSRTGMNMTGFYGLRFAVPDKQVPVTGQETVIVEDDAATGYQVVGDILIQWGKVVNATSGSVAITFTHPFKTVPTVSASGHFDGSNTRSAAVSTENVSTTGASINRYQSSDSSNANFDVMWTAVGEAPDALKKPKSVITGGGIAEYHDPTGAASWRIIGTTLECWGEVPGGTAITFPKTFARKPTVSANAEVNTSRYTRVWDVTTTGCSVQPWGGSSGTTEPTHWRAIGEWDGNL